MTSNLSHARATLLWRSVFNPSEQDILLSSAFSRLASLEQRALYKTLRSCSSGSWRCSRPAPPSPEKPFREAVGILGYKHKSHLGGARTPPSKIPHLQALKPHLVLHVNNALFIPAVSPLCACFVAASSPTLGLCPEFQLDALRRQGHTGSIHHRCSSYARRSGLSRLSSTAVNASRDVID